MRNNIYYVLISVTLLLAACDEDEKVKQKEVNTDGLLKSAVSFKYDQLPAHVREKASDDLTFAYLGETGVPIPKETGYYVQLIVDNHKLAEASTTDTAISQLLIPDEPYALYGKYRNTPRFFNASDSMIAKTLKHENYRLFHIGRNKNIDTAYYGPVNELPVRLGFSCWGLPAGTDIQSKISPAQ